MSRRIEPAARESLLRRRRALLGLRHELDAEERGILAESSADPLDRATAHGNADFLEALSEVERAELEEIHAALLRLDSGTFGRCLTCSRPIAQRRLEAIPWTSTCFECAESAESERENKVPHR
jgi:RNA polymerase-binding transcription factor DksA